MDIEKTLFKKIELMNKAKNKRLATAFIGDSNNLAREANIGFDIWKKEVAQIIKIYSNRYKKTQDFQSKYQKLIRKNNEKNKQ